MKFYGGVPSSTRKNWLNFGGDLGIVRWVNEQKTTIIVVAYPDRGAGNDPEPFFYIIILWWGGWLWGSLSQPRLNIFTVGNMRVMICLGQGGLRSLSASCLSSTCMKRNKHISRPVHAVTNIMHAFLMLHVSSRCSLVWVPRVSTRFHRVI